MSERLTRDEQYYQDGWPLAFAAGRQYASRVSDIERHDCQSECCPCGMVEDVWHPNAAKAAAALEEFDKLAARQSRGRDLSSGAWL